MDIKSVTTLSNGVKMPNFGLGVWQIADGEMTSSAVKEAIKAGYALVDTAAVYENEDGVGNGLKGINRESIFVTTKVWNADQGYDTTLKACDKSLKRLGLKYVDLYLIHWPVAGRLADTWKAMEKICSDGLAKAIGVSNFTEYHIKEIYKTANIKPMVNQIEVHPLLFQKQLIGFCRSENIAVQAYSPLGRGKTLNNPIIVSLAEKYGKSPAQIVLRWHLQNNILIIPKSSKAERIKENANIFDFVLSTEDMAKMDAINENREIMDKNRFFKLDEHRSVVL